jgi:predicted alpha-1,6-mannanase (GH76 family)
MLQLADQSTPAVPISLVTVALKVAATPAVIEAGGVIITVIDGRIKMDALPVAAASPAHWEEAGLPLQKIETAVTVTGLVTGIALGAV